jgi:hypothetical protein
MASLPDSARSHAPDRRRERTAYMFPIPGIETVLKACEIFGNAMYQGYAQTELLPVAMLEPPQWVAKDVPGSQPLHAELQISDENNRLPNAPSMAE